MTSITMKSTSRTIEDNMSTAERMHRLINYAGPYVFQGATIQTPRWYDPNLNLYRILNPGEITRIGKDLSEIYYKDHIRSALLQGLMLLAMKGGCCGSDCSSPVFLESAGGREFLWGSLRRLTVPGPKFDKEKYLKVYTLAYWVEPEYVQFAIRPEVSLAKFGEINSLYRT